MGRGGTNARPLPLSVIESVTPQLHRLALPYGDALITPFAKERDSSKLHVLTVDRSFYYTDEHPVAVMDIASGWNCLLDDAACYHLEAVTALTSVQRTELTREANVQPRLAYVELGRRLLNPRNPSNKTQRLSGAHIVEVGGRRWRMDPVSEDVWGVQPLHGEKTNLLKASFECELHPSDSSNTSFVCTSGGVSAPYCPNALAFNIARFLIKSVPTTCLAEAVLGYDHVIKGSPEDWREVQPDVYELELPRLNRARMRTTLELTSARLTVLSRASGSWHTEEHLFAGDPTSCTTHAACFVSRLPGKDRWQGVLGLVGRS